MDFNLLLNKEIPTSADFTANSINRALLKYACNHWIIRYSTPVIIGTIIIGVLFGFSYSLFLILLSEIGITGITWLYHYFLKADKFRLYYVHHLHNLIEEQTNKKRKNLKEDLIDFNNNRAAKQLDLFQKKFDTLVDILKTKFDTSQLTYNRYYSIAQEVFLSGIDNLSDIVLAHKTLMSIDLNYLNDRILELDKLKDKNNSVQKEYDALIRSLNSYNEQEKKIQYLMVENESALTQIDEATVAISEISRSKDKEAKIDMEISMKSLQELAQRSQNYSR